MSIKAKIRLQLTAIHRVTDTDPVNESLDVIWQLVDQLQEPPAVCRDPDLPKLGQAFWHKVGNSVRLAVVVNGRVEIRVQDAVTGGQIPLSRIAEWLPVVPPQFTEQGHD